jgi:hypothetical protein
LSSEAGSASIGYRSATTSRSPSSQRNRSTAWVRLLHQLAAANHLRISAPFLLVTGLQIRNSSAGTMAGRSAFIKTSFAFWMAG